MFPDTQRRHLHGNAIDFMWGREGKEGKGRKGGKGMEGREDKNQILFYAPNATNITNPKNDPLYTLVSEFNFEGRNNLIGRAC